MRVPDKLDLRAPENELALLVTRLLVRSALIWFVAMFLFGGVAGWSIAQWSQTRLGSVYGLVLSFVAAILVGAAFYYTNGTNGHSACNLGTSAPITSELHRTEILPNAK